VAEALGSMAKNSRLQSPPSLVVMVDTVRDRLDVQLIDLGEQTVVAQRMRGSQAAGGRWWLSTSH
jgi:hypothetical protein